METRFIGCLHLGHEGMARHRGFVDSWAHDDYLIEQWNSVVGKKDIVYILGDVTMASKKWYFKLDQLNGTKHVVLGNHDRRQDVPELLKYVDTVGGCIDWHGYMLTHAPVHPNEVTFHKGNIHAHIHHVNKLEEFVVHNRFTDVGSILVPTKAFYINVDAKLLNFKPRTIDELTYSDDETLKEYERMSSDWNLGKGFL